MAEHRANPACASATLMDPIGFAMENFDAIGRWRDAGRRRRADRRPGGLPDGSTFDGVAGLRAGAARSGPSVRAGTMTEKLLTYALGRGLEYYDAPAVRGIVRERAQRRLSFSSIVLGIVASVAVSR